MTESKSSNILNSKNNNFLTIFLAILALGSLLYLIGYYYRNKTSPELKQTEKFDNLDKDDENSLGSMILDDPINNIQNINKIVDNKELLSDTDKYSKVPGFKELSPNNQYPYDEYPKDKLCPAELLPADPNSKWAQVNPTGQGELGDQNFLEAGFHIGTNTKGQTLRNPNLQLRSEPPCPQVKVSPWMQSTIEADTNRRALEIGGGC